MTRIARVIDFETSGETPGTGGAGAQEEVVEVGYVDVDLETLQCSRTVSFLVHPRVPVTHDARAVHHITDAELDSGLPYDLWPLILNTTPAIGDEIACFVAHNSSFEAKFFEAENWFCTYKMALRRYCDTPRHALQYLRYALDLSEDPPFNDLRVRTPHRAGPDAALGAALFIRLIRDSEPADIHTFIDEGIKTSREPALLPFMTKGEHRGKRWSDPAIDDGYLEWIVQKDFGPGQWQDEKHTAFVELQRRAAQREAESEGGFNRPSATTVLSHPRRT